MATPIGSWNLPLLVDQSGAPIMPTDMRVVAWQDSAPIDINGLPFRAPVTVVWDAVNAGRTRLDFWEKGIPGLAYTADLSVKSASGSFNFTFRCDEPEGTMEAVAPPQHPAVDPTPFPRLGPSAFPFPPSGTLTKLPPFDAPDGPPDNNQVHTVPPPDLVVPTTRDVLFMRADFNGVTLPGSYTPTTSAEIIANGGVTITDGIYTGLFVPFLVGANTTPPTMIMTPMLVLYPEAVIVACLAEHAKRGYTHFIWDPHPWNLEENGRTFSLDDMIAWGARLKAYGFYNVIWSGQPSVADPMWHALAGNGLIDFAVIGEEVDGKFTAEEYASLVHALVDEGGALFGIPAAAHLTSNYPLHFPRDTFFAGGATGSWADFNGRLHLCWQANQNDSAGRRGALLYYARLRVNLGGIGGDGRPAPDCRVYDFENEASNELQGQDSEEKGNLQTLEDMYCTAPDAGVRPMSGYGNGCRNPNGTYFHLE